MVWRCWGLRHRPRCRAALREGAALRGLKEKRRRARRENSSSFSPSPPERSDPPSPPQRSAQNILRRQNEFAILENKT